MFKITSQHNPTEQSLSLIVEGRLTGPWVEELRTYCRTVAVSQQGRTLIDLTGVTFIDAGGKLLLTQLWQQGVELRASGCLTKCLLEDITRVGRTDSGGQHDGGIVR